LVPQDENNMPPQEPDNGEDSEHTYHLRLFVAGSSSRSQRAIDNIRQICNDHLQGKYELEVIDVYEQPTKAREYQILAIPTLLKELPPPLQKVIGDLSEEEPVLQGLDLQPK